MKTCLFRTINKNTIIHTHTHTPAHTLNTITMDKIRNSLLKYYFFNFKSDTDYFSTINSPVVSLSISLLLFTLANMDNHLAFEQIHKTWLLLALCHTNLK